MTRDNQIIQASEEWTYQTPPQYSELVHKSPKVMCAYQVGFIDGAVWADNNPNWISVEDELPEEGDTVLVTLKNRITTITTIAYCVDGEWYDNDYKINGIVTHWMPFPNPPKGGA